MQLERASKKNKRGWELFRHTQPVTIVTEVIEEEEVGK